MNASLPSRIGRRTAWPQLKQPRAGGRNRAPPQR